MVELSTSFAVVIFNLKFRVQNNPHTAVPLYISAAITDGNFLAETAINCYLVLLVISTTSTDLSIVILVCNVTTEIGLIHYINLLHYFDVITIYQPFSGEWST